jgi:hypothetical protein
MKATMENTSVVCTITTLDGQKIKARKWNAVSEKGIPFTAYVALVEVKSDLDNAEFERELSETKVERELVSFDLRLVI